MFAFWKGTGIATTQQLAQYYEVSVETVQKIIQRHRKELVADGLKTLKGKALKDVVDILSISQRTPNLTLWTPRAALRLGMVLSDSEVAAQVRTLILNVVEQVPAQSQEIERLGLEKQNLLLQLEVAQAQQAAAAAQHQATTAQNQLVASCSALALINPALPALVLGKPDAVMTYREVVQETVLVNAQGKAIASYLGYSKTKLAKRYGMKKPQDLVNWLHSIGRVDVLQPGLTATPCQYVPYEFVHELDALWMQHRGVRQRLIGE